MEQKDLNSVFASIDMVLNNIKLDDVSSESSGSTELPDGYYLCEVEKAEVTTSKTSGSPMVAFQFKVIENGVSVDVNEDGTITKTSIERTANRKIFMYYPIKDERTVKRFVSDMLKFEGEKPGEPILAKEYFMTSEVLCDALDIITGMNIYVQVATTKNKEGTDSTFKNLVSWKRIAALELE